jgi:hypothetical protein
VQEEWVVEEEAAAELHAVILPVVSVSSAKAASFPTTKGMQSLTSLSLLCGSQRASWVAQIYLCSKVVSILFLVY